MSERYGVIQPSGQVLVKVSFAAYFVPFDSCSAGGWLTLLPHLFAPCPRCPGQRSLLDLKDGFV